MPITSNSLLTPACLAEGVASLSAADKSAVCSSLACAGSGTGTGPAGPQGPAGSGSGSTTPATDTAQGIVALNVGSASGDATNTTDALTAAGFTTLATATGAGTPNAVQSAIAASASGAVFTVKPTTFKGPVVTVQQTVGAYASYVWDGTAYIRAAWDMPGVISNWASAAVPAGYLFCDGSTITAANYADLVAVIGTTLPDPRGLFIRGSDNGKGVDPGRTVNTFQPGSRIDQRTVAGASNEIALSLQDFEAQIISPVLAYQTTATTSIPQQSISGIARPSNLSLNYIIRF